MRAWWRVILLLLAGACEREARRFQEREEASRRMAEPVLHDPYASNAWAVAEGKRLWKWFNCVGCHSQGGGGMGPPLMDGGWRYGSAPTDVYASIVHGRPNGMPAFGARVPEYQVWQLVGYVRSMSAQLRFDVLPGRDDSLAVKPPEAREHRQRPYAEGPP